MKKTALILTALPCLLLTGCSLRKGSVIWIVVLSVLALLAGVLALTQTVSWLHYRAHSIKKHRRVHPMGGFTWGLYILTAVLILAAVLVGLTGKAPAPAETTDTTPPETTTEPPKIFRPEAGANSDPQKFGFQWEVLGEAPHSAMEFADPESYFALRGVSTFRGGPHRSGATFGKASVVDKKLETVWSAQTSSLPGENGTWTGSGWTGQPLLVQWDEKTRKNMNLYPEKKEKSGLVEVVYATLDGHIYFLDLEDGAPTREPVSLGLCFKGSGSLDPRGYPLLYVGAGDVNLDGKRPRMFVISLIDGSVLYEYGHEDANALREDHGRWCAFDSSPLVDARTDSLIWPGENGLLYKIHLNTHYNAEAGTVSVAPDAPVSARYRTNRSGQDRYWYGFEASASIEDHYLYVSENGGYFCCVDLDTMELVWAQDTKDDSNSSPAFRKTAEDQGCVYTAPSLHWTADENLHGTISIYKLDAVTGDILWQTPYDVYTVDGVSGGVQSSPLLGEAGTDLDGLILYTIARTPDPYTGLLVALDTATGREVWRMDMANYAWSSPVAVNGTDGKTYVVVCDSAGTVFFLEGATGQVLHQIDAGSLVEASPAVYENMLVVGTRGQKILGIRIS